MATVTKCECGKRMSKYARRCKDCDKKHFDQLHAQARAIVATGKCPDCGSPLVRNLSLAGWWQCAALPDLSVRKAEYAHLPKCSFQTFTE